MISLPTPGPLAAFAIAVVGCCIWLFAAAHMFEQFTGLSSGPLVNVAVFWVVPIVACVYFQLHVTRSSITSGGLRWLQILASSIGAQLTAVVILVYLQALRGQGL
jgi:hypothetical protein